MYLEFLVSSLSYLYKFAIPAAVIFLFIKDFFFK